MALQVESPFGSLTPLVMPDSSLGLPVLDKHCQDFKETVAADFPAPGGKTSSCEFESPGRGKFSGQALDSYEISSCLRLVSHSWSGHGWLWGRKQSPWC